MGALGTIWHEWYANLHRHAIDLARLNTNQIEVGATPEKVDGGWLLIYSHIQNYHASTLPKILGIEAALLAKDNPLKIIGRTVSPLLVPEADYELKGLIPNVAFPTSAIDRDDHFDLYYGAADTTLAVATMSKADMDAAINQKEHRIPKAHKIHYPIIEP
ncbi:MAG: hypothetical protein NTV34_15680 [Proteobacteria bacterium]|nr:hypothetical protein [Pseudomonadota bacterium]